MSIFSPKPEQRSELEELAVFIKTQMLRDTCPVCRNSLNALHAVAHVASCDFNGPNLDNGFLEEIRTRRWNALGKPALYLSTMDLMSCEAVRCPKGFALVVWVQIEELHVHTKYPVYIERIEPNVLDRVQEHIQLQWQQF